MVLLSAPPPLPEMVTLASGMNVVLLEENALSLSEPKEPLTAVVKEKERVLVVCWLEIGSIEGAAMSEIWGFGSL
jgi:hypothetical protein